MVTTRSADKQAIVGSKPETLTLRSKPEEDFPQALTSDPESVQPQSSEKRVELLVNVPPLRKRTRLSYSSAYDDRLAIDNTSKDPVGDQPNLTAAELSDSEKAVVKADHNVQAEPQADNISLTNDIATPKAREGAKRKRPAANITPKSSVPANPNNSDQDQRGRHKRFSGRESSEDTHPSEDNFKKSDEDLVVENASLDNDSEAPDTISSKIASQTAIHRSGRKTKNKRPTSVSEKVDYVLPTGIEEKGPVDQPGVDTRVSLESSDLPSLTVDTNQGSHSLAVNGNDSSSDSGFVTARTTRHIDIFTTPPGGTPQLRSPSSNRTGNEVQLRSAAKLSQHAQEPTSNVAIAVRREKVHKSKSNFGGIGTRSAALPARANHTLEDYRQQVLQSRSGRSFSLQENWPRKRQKFVVGF